MFRTNKIKFSIVILLILGIIFLSNCISDTGVTDLRGPLYAGTYYISVYTTCRKCHQEIYDSYVKTAHYNTSSDVGAISINSSLFSAFSERRNVFRFNDSTAVVMEMSDEEGKFYQSYLRGGKKLFSHPIDIVVGSGRKAYTFLYYNDKKKISQLPISYFVSEQAWANSPGFPADDAYFDRNVPSYCMGCHSSYIEVKQTYKGVVMQEEFEKDKLIYGIDCERCHGPALAHVQYFTDHPEVKQSKFVTSISSLNRVQKNDMCALCHSGFKDVLQSLFKFKPGDDLNNFYVADYGRIDTANLDVHGNQTQLMMASQCFRQSKDLTCTSCHNVHATERDNMALFSQRCANCHQQVKHSFASKNVENAVQGNCIDCHMPLKASKAITMLTNQKKSAVPDQIRTHLIAVYDKESKAFLDSLLKKK